MLKKLQRFYDNNRVYCILMLISLICVIIMGSAVLAYFIRQSHLSNYGSRLDSMEQYNIAKEYDELKKYFEEDKNVKSIKLDIKGKIIYVICEVETKLTNEQIQNLATESLKVLTDEQKEYFDLQFIFNRESYPPYLGSKSSNNKVISWTNYSFSTSTTTTTKKTTKKK